ncbi:MAG: ATP-binding protein [Pseudomonadota bacterium]
MVSINPKKTFLTLSEIRAEHRDLQKKLDMEALTDKDIQRIVVFIHRVREAGSYIGNEDDRWTCQGYLDYWATTLCSHSNDVPNAELTPFDENTAPLLEEADCPYVGLRSFQFEDADIFFGREDDISRIRRRLLEYRMIVVTGPSGSGKSSLVAAGIVPELLHRKDISSRDYVRSFSPGDNPLEKSDRINKEFDKNNDSSILVVIDLLEEIFTLNTDDAVADKFIDWMLSLTATEELKVFVVAILSDEFLHQFFMIAEEKHRCRVSKKPADETPKNALVARFSECEDRLYRLLPLDTVKLRGVIVKPARKRNLHLESQVVDSLVDDLSSEPTPLPLLQFALTKLWKQRKGNMVKLEHYQLIGGEGTLYESRGGAKDSLAICAEKLYWDLKGVAERYTFKNLLLRLIRLRADGGIALQRVLEDSLFTWTSPKVVAGSIERLREINRSRGIAVMQADQQISHRRLSEDILVIIEKNLGDRNIVQSVLQELYDAGLVRRFFAESSRDRQIEIAHEVLVRNWPTLHRWTQDKTVRQELEFIRELNRAASTWAMHDRAAGFLWTDDKQLKEIEKSNLHWQMNTLETEFLEESRSQAEESRSQAKRWKQFKTAVYFLLILALIVGISAFLVVYQHNNVQKEIAEAGLSELMAPFDEVWFLRIQYETIKDMQKHLPERPKTDDEKDAIEGLEKVAGGKSNCALIHLTRRPIYGKQNAWIWSGFTTKFIFPGTNDKLLLAMLGKTDKESPTSLSIEFTQYKGVKHVENPSNKNPSIDKRVIRFTIDFHQKENRYSGDMFHPVLKNSDGEYIQIGTMILYNEDDRRQVNCE